MVSQTLLSSAQFFWVSLLYCGWDFTLSFALNDLYMAFPKLAYTLSRPNIGLSVRHMRNISLPWTYSTSIHLKFSLLILTWLQFFVELPSYKPMTRQMQVIFYLQRKKARIAKFDFNASVILTDNSSAAFSRAKITIHRHPYYISESTRLKKLSTMKPSIIYSTKYIAVYACGAYTAKISRPELAFGLSVRL